MYSNKKKQKNMFKIGSGTIQSPKYSFKVSGLDFASKNKILVPES